MCNSRRLTALVTALLTSISAVSANAGLILNLNDDGSGFTAGTLTGTYDVSTGGPAGTSLPGGGFGPNGNSGVRLERISEATAPGASKFLSLPPDAGNKAAILANLFSHVPSQLTVDDFGIYFSGSASTSLVVFEGSFTGMLNEEFSYTTVPFSNFNTGTWNWGGGSTTTNGFTLQIGSRAVPEPSNFTLVGVGLTMLGLYRQRRNDWSMELALR